MISFVYMHTQCNERGMPSVRKKMFTDPLRNLGPQLGNLFKNELEESSTLVVPLHFTPIEVLGRFLEDKLESGDEKQ